MMEKETVMKFEELKAKSIAEADVMRSNVTQNDSVSMMSCTDCCCDVANCGCEDCTAAM